MNHRLGIVMDPIESINPGKDSSLAMLLAAQARGWTLYYMQLDDLYVDSGRALAGAKRISVTDSTDHWVDYAGSEELRLGSLDVILMRKDPPFDMEYIYATYILQLAEQQGALVVNNPRALRDANEKFFTAWFPDCCAPTLITRSRAQVQQFLQQHGQLVLKPLDGMGGESVFKVGAEDPNFNVIMESLSRRGTRFVIAQRYIPEITHGDKRILLIDGEPVPYALARIPGPGDHRGNLAAGGTGKGIELSPRDRAICRRVGPVLKQMGLVFVGLDVIGDFLTEINVTSPTCIRELDALYQLDIAGRLIECIERKLDCTR